MWLKADLTSMCFPNSVSSLRLAYKDLEIHVKKDENPNLRGQKKVEAERLGMGFGSCRRYGLLGLVSPVQFAHGEGL